MNRETFATKFESDGFVIEQTDNYEIERGFTSRETLTAALKTQDGQVLAQYQGPHARFMCSCWLDGYLRHIQGRRKPLSFDGPGNGPVFKAHEEEEYLGFTIRTKTNVTLGGTFAYTRIFKDGAELPEAPGFSGQFQVEYARAWLDGLVASGVLLAA